MSNLKSKCIVLYLIYIVCIHCQETQEINKIDKALQKGVKAYKEEKWSKCIERFEESLHLFKAFKSVLTNCRTKCNSLFQESQVKENFDDLKIYEHFFNKRDCLSKCHELGFRDIRMGNNLEDAAFYNMQSRRPYEYLHMCYFQMHMFHKAASSAYTYLVANPTDETMRSNLKYYTNMPEVDPEEIVDLESEDYAVLFKLGKKSYKMDNWAETVASMEEALRDYISSENDCRAECEHHPGQESTSEFVMTVSNNIAALLHCQQQCQDKLKIMKFNSGTEFLAEILNYLQISYYHLERFENTARNVDSYLLLMPYDEVMLANKKFYRSHIDEKEFVTRSDIVHYYKRDNYEKNLLDFFHQGENNSIDINPI